MNLLSNAIKFTSNGLIKLKALLIEDNNIELSVEDNGIGIK